MTNEEYLHQILAPYGPQAPLSRLVVEVNKIYHAFEAADYDARHPEITTQLPPLWQAMCRYAVARRPAAAAWRILDFGAGTGFEAEQLLRHLPPGSVAALTCYDPAPEMLARGRARIAPLFPAAVFTTNLEDVSPPEEGYNLLATNSLLHHLPDAVATVTGLLPLLAADALWLAGHEPSNRFHANRACAAAHAAYLRQYRWRRLLSPGKYWYRVRLLAGQRRDPARLAAQEAHRQGLFGQAPPPALIGRLVDYSVAFTAAEAAAGRGLDFRALARAFAGVWDLRWVRTYAYMGLFYEGDLPQKWARVCRTLAAKYPDDGANFCAIWQRV